MIKILIEEHPWAFYICLKPLYQQAYLFLHPFQLTYLPNEAWVFPLGRQLELSECSIFAFSCCPFSHVLWTAISKFSFFISSRLLGLWYYTRVSALVSTQAVPMATRSSLCAFESMGAFSAGHTDTVETCAPFSALNSTSGCWAAKASCFPVFCASPSSPLAFTSPVTESRGSPCATLSAKLALWTSEF